MPRTFIIGDIHGCFDELMELIKIINLKEEDLLVSVGDIVDRGNKSKEVYGLFKNRPNAKVLAGNHERKHQNQVFSYAQEIVKLQFGDVYPEFLKWVDTLDYYLETEDAIIVHAALEHDKALSEQKEEVLCGSTSGERYLEKKYPEGTYWNDHYTGIKPVIFGHRVVGDVPEFKNNTWAIDTGCCHGGYLTAIELPGFIIHQVKSKKDYWKEEQRIWQIPVLKSKNWENMDFDTIHKQLEKLSYINDAEVKTYLGSIAEWCKNLQNLIPEIKQQLEVFTQELYNKHPENFNIEASKCSFRTFVFKCNANNLKTEDLSRALNTPAKIVELAKKLNMKNIQMQ